MKLEAMKRKAGQRSKVEALSGEKPMRADEQLAQQTGESRTNIQKHPPDQTDPGIAADGG